MIGWMIKCLKTTFQATQVVLENDFIYLKTCTVEYVNNCCHTSYEYKMNEYNYLSGVVIPENYPNSCIGKKYITREHSEKN